MNMIKSAATMVTGLEENRGRGAKNRGFMNRDYQNIYGRGYRT